MKFKLSDNGTVKLKPENKEETGALSDLFYNLEARNAGVFWVEAAMKLPFGPDEGVSGDQIPIAKFMLGDYAKDVKFIPVSATTLAPAADPGYGGKDQVPPAFKYQTPHDLRAVLGLNNVSVKLPPDMHNYTPAAVEKIRRRLGEHLQDLLKNEPDLFRDPKDD